MVMALWFGRRQHVTDAFGSATVQQPPMHMTVRRLEGFQVDGTFVGGNAVLGLCGGYQQGLSEDMSRRVLEDLQNHHLLPAMTLAMPFVTVPLDPQDQGNPVGLTDFHVSAL